jgi:uncharacterized membrane protein (DUF4010 family)
MELSDLFIRFGTALAIGFFVGLQREYAHGGPGKEIFAGERTLALMGLLGCAAAMAADELGSAWPFVVIVALAGVLVSVAYAVGAWRGYVGLTTEATAIVIVLAGALCYWDRLALAAAIAVVTTVLLSIKLETDVFVKRLTREDIYAALKFAVITAIILPVLPNETYGPPPLDVLNPHKIWLMVVLISAIGFLGYVLVKVTRPRQGIGLTGLLGGLVSSTATTAFLSQRSRGESTSGRPLALAIIIAWTMMFVRVVIEVAAVNSELLGELWPALAITGAAGLAYCVYLVLQERAGEDEVLSFANPFELGPAVKFGLVYVVILLLSAAAQEYLGNAGVYLSSAIAGLADVDAITLSMAELSRAGGTVAVDAAKLAIVLATLSNTVVKGGIVLTTGSARLRRALLPGLVLMLVAGLGAALLL